MRGDVVVDEKLKVLSTTSVLLIEQQHEFTAVHVIEGAVLDQGIKSNKRRAILTAFVRAGAAKRVVVHEAFVPGRVHDRVPGAHVVTKQLMLRTGVGLAFPQIYWL